MSPTVAPFGSWRSPISAADVASAGVTIGQLEVGPHGAVWVESRPTQGGRYVCMHRSPDGRTTQITPDGFNVRTRVHEYGGGAFVLLGESVVFANFDDQRLYRQDPGAPPQPITPEPSTPRALRYADARPTRDGALVCVRERHADDGVHNEVVRLATDGPGDPRVVASGHDFYAAPRPSPDGSRTAWVAWDHPNMPWDATHLYLDGRVAAAGSNESVTQPSWSPDGVLHFVSDRTGWWNLYRLGAAGAGGADALAPLDSEFAGPAWAFGGSSYCFLSGGRIACAYGRGRQTLGVIAPGSGRVEPVETPYTSLGYLRADPDGEHVWCVAASPTRAGAVVRVDARTGDCEVVRRSREVDADARYVSPPVEIEFQTDGGLTAYAHYYAPKSADFTGAAGARPPLLVFSHGGPTGAASSTLNLTVQYFTSRGMAVVDVNYGGSTGYGRAYRERLKGTWGITDVRDCVNAARHLADQGLVDGGRVAIRGGSAGGYTTLCALVFTDVFSAGASYFGVADAEALARDTHKFESRYLDGLIGPYPEAVEVYRDRSPIHFTDQLSCPVILFQGLEDEIVPPNQAEAMVAALQAKRIPHAYLAFEGEQHGFRKAENVVRTLEAELYFYSRIFGFDLADPVAPVEITPPPRAV